jgi:ubiquinone/menaquinone biosynthesis C-methylase UbiE
VAEALAIDSRDRLLEVGCGHGVSASLVCERLDSGHITAIDRSTKMIEMAAKRNRAAVAAWRADFQGVPLERADFGDDRFDKVFGDRLSGILRKHDFPVEDVAVGPGPMVGVRARPA